MTLWDELHSDVLAAFGEQAIYYMANGQQVPVSVVFDEAFRLSEPVGSYGAQSSTPVCGIQLSQLPGPIEQGDALGLIRTGERFAVNEPEPDGKGWAILRLNLITGGP